MSKNQQRNSILFLEEFHLLSVCWVNFRGPQQVHLYDYRLIWAHAILGQFPAYRLILTSTSSWGNVLGNSIWKIFCDFLLPRNVHLYVEVAFPSLACSPSSATLAAPSVTIVMTWTAKSESIIFTASLPTCQFGLVWGFSEGIDGMAEEGELWASTKESSQ